jgi:2-polyprenyl-3-methyl-5-hydroxy-6-metoxy-1,4-benzoquinol methylase
MSCEPTWHYLDWDETRVRRFWDFAARWPAWQNDYFAKQVGLGVVNLLRRLLLLQGRILDYGCGPGYLIGFLLRAGIACEGADSSPQTVDAVNNTYAGNPLWKGAKLLDNRELPFPDDSFDLIICLETIEHVLPEHTEAMLSELRRIMKPTIGRLFLTTPNAENLEESQVYCPECGAVFHRYQHVRSFTRSTLQALMSASGFRTDLCEVTVFNQFQNPLFSTGITLNLNSIARYLKWIWASLLDISKAPGTPIGGRRLHQLLGSGPHLFWLGVKE